MRTKLKERSIRGCKFNNPEITYSYSSPEDNRGSDPGNELFDTRKSYNPWDYNTRRFDSVSIPIIVPEKHKQEAEDFAEFLRDGVNYFPGMENVFGISVKTEVYTISVDLNKSLIKLSESYEEEVKDILPEITSGENTIPVVAVPNGPKNQVDSPYYTVKSLLLRSAIPSQMVNPYTLSKKPQKIQYDLRNIALGIYAKNGGIPWALYEPESQWDQADCIIGIGQHMKIPERIGSKPKYMGFMVARERNGSLIALKGTPSVYSSDNYLNHFEDELRDIISSYKDEKGKYPDKIALHLQKSPNKEEKKIINDVVRSIDKGMEYYILQIRDPPASRMFETTNPTFTIQRGMCAQLSKSSTLLASTGQDGIGTPKPLYISLRGSSRGYKPHPVEASRQVYRLTAVNWGGTRMNERLPASIKSAKSIARLVSSMYAEDWDDTLEQIHDNNLRHKFWWI